MAPRQPRQLRTIGTESRRRVEVVPAGNDVSSRTAAQRNADQRVDRLAGAGVVLANADQATSARIDGVVCVEPLSLRCNGNRFTGGIVGSDMVNPLISEVREIDVPAIDNIGAAAVFVHA